MIKREQIMAKPFLKWAGGKKWFVNQERDRLLLDFNRYIEPFLGGGSVFFYINPQQAILSDINAELVNAYICLRDEFESVYKKLHIHQIHNSEEYYYIIRDRQTRTNATSAARTIYLNKACFNGVYRVNRDGKFNVPYGKVKNLIFDRNALQESSIALRGTEILCQDFEATIDQAEQNDFIFCDPPYAVLNEDNRFVSYTANLFSWNDQVRLSHALNRAAQRGVKILMTNVDHQAVRALYEVLHGFELEVVERKCVISSQLKAIQAIQLALQKCSFFSTFAKNNTIATNGSFDVGDNQATIDRFYPFLEGCFKTVKNECETEWSLGEQGILTINRGIQGIIRIINDVVNLLIAQNKLFPLTQDIDDIINEVEYYMSPLLNHINKLTEEQRIELKSFYGGGAENKYLHYFQKVIHDSLTDFNPEGLEEYIENTTKEYNATSKEYIYAIEEKLKDVIAESLQEYYGDKWLIKGLPKTTYKEAEKAASDKNYELLSNDEESDIEPWDCISLSDCKDIVVYSRNWSEIFESIITRPEDLILSTKEQKTEWINTISKEQNKLSKSTYSVPKSSFELISNIYAWLVGTD